MRRTLGTFALLALLGSVTACGDDAPDTADDPAPTDRTSDVTTPTTTPPTEPGTGTPTDPTDPTKAPPLTPPTLDYTVVALEHQTAAGGTTQDLATPVGPGGDTGGFLGQLTDATFRETVEQRITFSRATGDLYAAVVSVGCDVPPGVTVSRVDDQVAIVAQKVPDPTPECFAPVTTVAVVAVRD